MIPAYQAVDLYEHTLRRGRWHQVGARLRGQTAKLPNLAMAVGDRPINAHPCIGTQTVPINQIRGSEGRRDDFDDAFRPIQARTSARWQSIARAWLQGAKLPPVSLIRLGDVYYVRDGHHQISVARTLGQREIDAIVTVWDVATPVRGQ